MFLFICMGCMIALLLCLCMLSLCKVVIIPWLCLCITLKWPRSNGTRRSGSGKVVVTLVVTIVFLQMQKIRSQNWIEMLLLKKNTAVQDMQTWKTTFELQSDGRFAEKWLCFDFVQSSSHFLSVLLTHQRVQMSRNTGGTHSQVGTRTLPGSHLLWVTIIIG